MKVNVFYAVLIIALLSGCKNNNDKTNISMDSTEVSSSSDKRDKEVSEPENNDVIRNHKEFYQLAPPVSIPVSFRTDNTIPFFDSIKTSDLMMFQYVYKTQVIKKMKKNLQEHYSFKGLDMESLLSDTSGSKYYALGKIRIPGISFFLSELIYHQLSKEGTMYHFLYMVNRNTNSEEYFNTAILAIQINDSNTGNIIRLSSDLSENKDLNGINIDQNFLVLNGTKVLVNKGMHIELNPCTICPGEGSEYIKYMDSKTKE